MTNTLVVSLVDSKVPKYLNGQNPFLSLTPKAQQYLLYTKDLSNCDFFPGNSQNLFWSLYELGQACRNLSFDSFELDKSFNLEQALMFASGFYTLKLKDNKSFKLADKLLQQEFDKIWQHQKFIRRLVNTSADVLTPVKLAQEVQAHLEATAKQAGFSAKAVKTKLTVGQDLVKAGYNGTYTVGKGSVNPPVLLELDFNPTDKKDAPVVAALVGKGITFDTGGYCIKPTAYMEGMFADMGGAALMATSLAQAITLGLKQRVKLFLSCAENMISNNAFRPGDIITYANGLTVVNEHTDAEGRLVLADSLILASQANNGTRPEFIIDAATLTGAAKGALGSEYSAVMSFDDQAYARFMQANQGTFDPFWRLPLTEVHRKQMESKVADITNDEYSRDLAWASTAAGFLSYFVEDYKKGWLHLDLAIAYSDGITYSQGATGLGVDTVVKFLLALSPQQVNSENSYLAKN